jgi:peptidoglycan L-alanyl-D-glutamate endopeptidase CwlK
MPVTPERLIFASQRRIAALRPELITKVRMLLTEASARGHVLIVTQGLRTDAEQDALYAQGRTKPGAIVTYARAGESAHNFGAAVDFAFLVDGAISWDDALPWADIGAIGESLGLVWGGRWEGKKRDRPHLELPGWKRLDS